MRFFSSWMDGSKILTKNLEINKSPSLAETENNVLNVYPSELFQTIDGFGGAITDSASSVYLSLSQKDKTAFLKDCYGADGLRYTLGRCSIGSCDFSLKEWDGTNGEDLSSISLVNDEEHVIPMLIDIYKMKKIKLFMAPWSPPERWKESGSRIGGSFLKKQFYGDYAKYLVNYVKSYVDLGFVIATLSLQNEPHATQRWDSCLFSESEERELIPFVGNELSLASLSKIRILVYDHNKERLFDYVDYLLSHDDSYLFVGAAGYHWYSGDHFESIGVLRRKYPALPIYFTEGCNEHSNNANTSEASKGLRYAREISNGINYGSNGFLDWNVLLDKDGGPNNAQNFCDAPIMLDESGKPTKRFSYYCIWHYSHFINPGATVVATTRYSDSIDFCAVKNPNGELVMVLANNTESEQKVFIRMFDMVYALNLPPLSASTGLVPSDELNQTKERM